MKKIRYAFIVLALVCGTISFTSCGSDETPTPTPTPTSHEYVDLGLPSGTLWATCNVGASKPEEYGDYFAWGETIGYSGDTSDGRSFNWNSYKYCNGRYDTMTKYCTSSSYGTVDNKTELEAVDDAATANWGSEWKMPTKAQLNELVNSSYTTTTWTIQNGVYGILITSKMTGYTDKSIFLPAAGYRMNNSLSSPGDETSPGKYWSSTLNSGYSNFAIGLNFNSSRNVSVNPYDRSDGYSVRPVRSTAK